MLNYFVIAGLGGVKDCSMYKIWTKPVHQKFGGFLSTRLKYLYNQRRRRRRKIPSPSEMKGEKKIIFLSLVLAISTAAFFTKTLPHHFKERRPTCVRFGQVLKSKATHIRLSDNTRINVSSMMPSSFSDAHQPPLQLRRVWSRFRMDLLVRRVKNISNLLVMLRGDGLRDLQTPFLRMGTMKGFGTGSLVSEALVGSDAGGLSVAICHRSCIFSGWGGFEKGMRRISNLIGEKKRDVLGSVVSALEVALATRDGSTAESVWLGAEVVVGEPVVESPSP